MSTHEEILALIPGYPELAAHERLALDAHAETCAQCAAALQRYRRLRSEIAHAPRLSPDPRAVDAVAAAIRRTTAPWSGAAAGSSRVSPLAILSILGLLLLAGAGLWLAGQARSRTAGVFSPGPLTMPVPVATNTPTPPPAETPAGVTPADDAEGFADAVAWLKQNTVPLAGAEPGGSTADLAALRDVVGRGRVVVLDDSTYYGTHELQAMQQRILQYLVQEMGFNHILLDAPWTRVEPIGAYTRSNTGNLDEVLPGLTETGWRSAEMTYTFRWLNAYNQAPGASGPVALQGFLPAGDGKAKAARDLVQAYLAAAAPNEPVAAAAGAVELAERLAAHPNMSTAPAAVGLYNRTTQAVRILRQTEQLAGAANDQQRRQLAIQFAADNLLASVDQAAPGEKFLIWTHGRAGGLADPEGLLTFLRTHYGAEMVSLGFVFRQGALYAPASPATVSAGPPLVQVPPAVAGSYEDLLAQAGLSRYLLDLRRVAPRERQTRWFVQSHLRWQLLAGRDECYPEDAFSLAQLQTRLDAIIYFERVSPATPLVQVAAPRPAACPMGPENLDFSAGTRAWSLVTAGPPEYQWGTTAGAAGERAGYLKWAGPAAGSTTLQRRPGSSATLWQVFRADNFRGRRVRLSATLQPDAPTVVAALGLQVNGPLYATHTSSRAAQMQVAGAARRYDLVLDVPTDATRIMLSLSLASAGKVSISAVRFEVVGSDVPVSPAGPVWTQ